MAQTNTPEDAVKTAPGENAPAAPNTATAVNEEGAVKKIELSPFAAQTKDMLANLIGDYNQVVTQLRTLTGDLLTVRDAVMADRTDEKVAKVLDEIEKYNSEIEKRKAALTTYATEKAKKKIEEQHDPKLAAELSAKADVLDKTIKPLRKSFLVMAGDDAKSLLPDILSVKSGTATGSGSSQEGVRRLRGFKVSVDGKLAQLKNNKQELVSSFSAAAKVIGVPTETLQQKYMDTVGSSDAANFPTGKEVTFELEHDNKKYVVAATREAE